MRCFTVVIIYRVRTRYPINSNKQIILTTNRIEILNAMFPCLHGCTNSSLWMMLYCNSIITWTSWRLNSPLLDSLLTGLCSLTSKKTSEGPLLSFVRGIHRWQVDSPRKGQVTRKAVPISWSYCLQFIRPSSIINVVTLLTKSSVIIPEMPQNSYVNATVEDILALRLARTSVVTISTV